MKVYHRIFGDPPNKGFDNSIISSIGFPGGAKFADAIKNIRLPRAKGKEMSDEEYVIYQEAFEYQTISFGQPAVIHSMFAGKSSGGSASRPHGFTHIAAPKSGGAERLTLDDVSPAQLMRFGELLTVREFWDIPKNTETWPVTEWELPAADAAQPSVAADMPQEMADALALRYWRAVSTSFFSDSQTQQPVEICLDNETDGNGIIEASKAFFAAEIVPRLPKAALNILSMSTPAYQNPDSAQSFQPTALLFLFPEQEFEAHENFFDLRSGRFTPLDSWHAAFIRRILGDELSPGLRHAWETYSRHTNKTDPSHCTFLSDYQVAYGMESIERGRIDARQAPHELLSQWRALLHRLHKYHQLDLPLCQEMLRPVIQSALRQFADMGVAFPLNKEQLFFLFSQALVMEGSQEADEILRLIERHQAARMEPFFLSSLPWQELPGKAAAVAAMMERILTECYVKDPPSTAVLQVLSSPKLASICDENADCKLALERYIGLLAQEHAEICVDLLPLARRYSDPTVILYNTANLLVSRYVDAVPGAEVCEDLRHLLAAANNPEIQSILDKYFYLLYVRHLEKPEAFLQTVQAITTDMTGSVQAILRTASETLEFLDSPLGEDELGLLTVKIADQILQPDDVRQSLLAYADAVILRAMDTEFDWFTWLFSLDSLGDWLTKPIRCATGIRHLPVWMLKRRRVLDASEFSNFLACAKGEHNDVFLEHESQYAAAYELLGNLGEAQLQQLLPLFQHVSDTRFVRQKYLDWLQSRAVYHWERDFPADSAAGLPANTPADIDDAYWLRVSQLRDKLPVCGETPDISPLPRRARGGGNDATASILRRPPDDRRVRIFIPKLPAAAAGRRLYRVMASGIGAGVCSPLWRNPRPFHRGSTGTAGAGDSENCNSRGPDATGQPGGTLLPGSAGSGCVPHVAWHAEQFHLTSNTLRVVRGLRQCMQELQTPQPLLALQRYCMQPDVSGRIASYRYVARIAVGLICTCWADNGFSAKHMIPFLIGPGAAVPANPYAPESRKYLQAVVSLLNQLSQFEPHYPARLLDELATDPDMAAYTARLLARKTQLYSLFPWCAPGYPIAEWQARTALYAWLTRTPVRKKGGACHVRRDQPNWIAFGCSIAYMLSFLLLPFYRVLLYRVSGWSFIQQNAVMAIPLILGMLMAISAILAEARISVFIAATSALTTFILMLTAKNLLIPTVIVQQNISTLVSQPINSLVNSLTLQVTIGVGAVLALLNRSRFWCLSCCSHLLKRKLRRGKPTISISDDDSQGGLSVHEKGHLRPVRAHPVDHGMRRARG